MTDFDTLIKVESAQQHSLTDPDLLAFSVITAIAREESQRRQCSRFRIGIVLAITASLIVLQLIAFNGSNLTKVIGVAKALVSTHPLMFSAINFFIAAVIVFAHRIRLI